MMNDLIAFTQTIGGYALLLTCQLVLIMIVRKPVLQLFGAVHAYRLWLLPAIWAPLFFIDWSWFQGGVVQTWVTDTVLSAPVNLLSPALEWLPEQLSGPLPMKTQDEVAGIAATARKIDWQTVLAALWLTGVLILLIRQGLAFCLFVRHVNKCAIAVPEREKPAITKHASISTRVPLYTLPGIGTPALFGLINPVLLLPEDFMTAYDSDQRHLILSHEAVHLQRRDNLWNLCAWSFKALFWFNPLAHLAYRYYRADQELSCDALALAHSNAGQRRRYARTLLESFGRPGTCHQSLLLTAWGSLNTIKERTAMIKQYSQCKSRPRLFRVSLLTLILTGACITALMTDTLSPLTLAADAAPTASIPVDRAALSATVNGIADRTTNLISEYEYDAAEASLNELRSLELNDQERFLLLRLTGDLALARRNAAAAVAAYTEIQNLSGLSQIQREDALLQLADAYIAEGYQSYKPALAIYRQLDEMAGGRNPDYLYRIATTLHLLKQNDNALIAVRKAIETYDDNAPRFAYSLLWQLTRDIESKRQIHETLVEKFNDPQDIARLALFTREDGSYDHNVIGGCFTTPAGGTCRPNADRSIQLQSATVTPDNIRFAPSAGPLEFVQPVYPEEARLNGMEGWHLVVLDLDENGAVSNAVILDSTLGGTFDNATLTAIRQFRFDPSQLESTSGDVDLVYLFRYQLSELD
jgi:TonB family protein